LEWNGEEIIMVLFKYLIEGTKKKSPIQLAGALTEIQMEYLTNIN